MPPAPAVQAPQQESVAGLDAEHVTAGEQPGNTASGPAGETSQPGSVYTPAVQTPGAGEPTDPTNGSEQVTPPDESSHATGGSTDPSVPASESDPDGSQGTPLGPTNPGSVVKVATAGSAAAETAGLPSRQHLRASLEVTVADPEQVAGDLKEQLALAKEVRQDKRVNVVELQVTVAASDFTDVVQQVEQVFAAQNARAQLDPVELSGQLDEVAQQIASLQAQRADLATRLEGESDPKTLEVGALALANLDKEIAAQEASYQNLLDSLENGEIQIVLKPEPLQ